MLPRMHRISTSTDKWRPPDPDRQARPGALVQHSERTGGSSVPGPGLLRAVGPNVVRPFGMEPAARAGICPSCRRSLLVCR